MPFNRKDKHNPGEIRPRFKLRTDYSKEEVFDLLDQFCKDDSSVLGRRVYDQYYLDIPNENRHFWSPELRVTLEDDEEQEGMTLVRVMVGPQYVVWTMFVFIYVILGLVSLFGGMYGFSQMSLGNKSPWIWCAPFGLVLFISVYIIAKMGQRTGRDQTLHLVSVLYHSIGDHKLERVEI